MIKNILKNRTFVYGLCILEAILTLYALSKFFNFLNYFNENWQTMTHIESTQVITEFVISLVIWLPFTIFISKVAYDYFIRDGKR